MRAVQCAWTRHSIPMTRPHHTTSDNTAYTQVWLTATSTFTPHPLSVLLIQHGRGGLATTLTNTSFSDTTPTTTQPPPPFPITHFAHPHINTAFRPAHPLAILALGSDQASAAAAKLLAAHSSTASGGAQGSISSSSGSDSSSSGGSSIDASSMRGSPSPFAGMGGSVGRWWVSVTQPTDTAPTPR